MRKKSLKKEFRLVVIIILTLFCLSFLFLHFYLFLNSNQSLKTLFHRISLALDVISIIIGTYYLVRIYHMIIKPMKEAQDIVNQINEGNNNLRLKYHYNNEIQDLVNSFNRFIDESQNSLVLIEEQYNRLKLYSDVGEINYVEFNFSIKTIKIYYCKPFIEKYHLEDNIMTYSVKEYLSYVHPEDRKKLFDQLKFLNKMSDKEYKLDFRLKFPNALDYCYVSTIGKIYKEQDYQFIGVQVDITYLKKIQHKLHEKEEEYRLIVENSTDLISKMSPTGEMLITSKSFKELFKEHNVYVGDYNHLLKKYNENWLEEVKKPPYSTQNIILIETEKGEKWISWNNDAILDENGEVEYIISVGHDITELKRINDKLLYDAEHDELTGLLNRRGLFKKIDELKNVKKWAAFFIDLNNFKNINDLYGHDVGDNLICLLANELKKLEKFGYIICRLYGDNFLVVVPNYTDDKSLSFIINYLEKYLNRSYHLGNNDIYLSASIGYALYPDDTTDFDKLISYADIAMFKSKTEKSNKCFRFNKEMYDNINNKVGVINDLKRAIEKDEFDVYFQEIVDVKSQEVAYIEALIRWHSNKGVIMPKDFIPIAEETGFIQTLDLIVINKALRYFKNIKLDKRYQNTKLTINVSPALLLNKNFPDNLNDLTHKLHIANDEVCIEINENTFVNNKEESRKQIKLLKDLGFLIALDDFGREYSSLSILNKVDFDIIKIDRLFIINLDLRLNVEIINMINKIAQLSDNIVIVEGVETEEQKEKLMNLGCYLMQGFLFSKPAKILVKEKVEV